MQCIYCILNSIILIVRYDVVIKLDLNKMYNFKYSNDLIISLHEKSIMIMYLWEIDKESLTFKSKKQLSILLKVILGKVRHQLSFNHLEVRISSRQSIVPTHSHHLVLIIQV